MGRAGSCTATAAGRSCTAVCTTSRLQEEFGRCACLCGGKHEAGRAAVPVRSGSHPHGAPASQQVGIRPCWYARELSALQLDMVTWPTCKL